MLLRRPPAELGQLLPTLPREYFTTLGELPFHVGPEFNLANAWWCAETAMLAYQEPAKVPELTARLTPAGWQVRTFGEQLPTYAVLLTSPDVAILAFRGTRVSGFRTFEELYTQPPINLKDLKTDFNFTPTHFPIGGTVHEGFLEAFEKFWRIHELEIMRCIGARASVVTGHSLGGALATIA